VALRGGPVGGRAERPHHRAGGGLLHRLPRVDRQGVPAARLQRPGQELSNHASATALDINSLEHPNNVPTRSTFTVDQVAACHQILDSIPELSEVVHWGGDWFPPLVPDAMHWELHDHDLPKLARVADLIRALEDTLNADDKAWLENLIDTKLAANNPTLVKAVWDAVVDRASHTARAALRKAAGL
jgi:hypothetical protein